MFETFVAVTTGLVTGTAITTELISDTMMTPEVTTISQSSSVFTTGTIEFLWFAVVDVFLLI